MGSMNIPAALRRIESQFRFDADVCWHVGPVIHWLDGAIENGGVNCTCGKPHMMIYLGLSDGSDRRTQTARLEGAAENILNFRKENPEIPIEQLCEWALKDYGIEFDQIYGHVQRKLADAVAAVDSNESH